MGLSVSIQFNSRNESHKPSQVVFVCLPAFNIYSSIVKGQVEGTQILDKGRQRRSERKRDLLGQGVNDKLGLGKR